MSNFNLLLVEDNEKEVNIFRDTLERYSAERNRNVDVIVATKLDESLLKLNNYFDGAIVDIRLGRDNDAGNKLIEEIQSKFRIPIAVYTANPANVTADVKVFPRASVTYDAPLDFLFDMYETGLTRIFGGRGYIEDAMNRVFWGNVYPQLDDWKRHKSSGKETEKALLRFIINHIVELVDQESEKYFPEEMYIAPVISNTLKTGCIVRRQDTDQYYVVLSPACDLTLHENNYKTDRIMVCLIEKADMSIVRTGREDVSVEILDSDDEETIKVKMEKIERAKRILFQLPRNNYAPYFHYLPPTSAFQGGFINFRKIETYKPSEFGKSFGIPAAQISSAFTKDVVARFSSYYARQGQPDFDLE